MKDDRTNRNNYINRLTWDRSAAMDCDPLESYI